MVISTRTPEGLPHQCPVCGDVAALDVSAPGGDTVCPRCGHLLWTFRDRLHQICGAPLDEIALSSLLREDLGVDSLTIVELVMEIEEERRLVIPDADYEQFRSVRDVIEYLRRLQRDTDAA